MSLACLVCRNMESPSQSFRSYSLSSSDNEGRCSAIANCLARAHRISSTHAASSSKVTPQPTITSNGVTDTPRLVRSCAVRRDLVRNWNFDGVVISEATNPKWEEPVTHLLVCASDFFPVKKVGASSLLWRNQI